MNRFMDGVILLLFVLFMVWIIRGYHAQKYESRYGGERREDVEKENEA